MQKEKKSNIRAFVSIWLFVFLIILFGSAIGIEIFDHIIKDQPRFLFQLKRIHSIVGYMFIALGSVHIILNWKVLRSYMKRNEK